ncbi:hypothetical protein SELMODRAFT_236128 [Selaginella moellendorffii]|uniref:Thaumatin-like protein n=1 Tax=Selaginella moellendorffii TaxID=88036 RepID=D8T5A9_SELML|nr:pathogenesis-related protein 5 [Selaginella moellendorffii]EFJ08050.1 hypothetical protein SELMODRAFT_236128 [Selaginella moellendorffii]|eukprot:XP_002990777.1 pathogenesis-related protein 5 [Selaginella moellendorffii]
MSFLTLLLLLFFTSAHGVTFTLNNSCSFTVWPGWLNGDGESVLEGGYKLDPSHSVQLSIPSGWGGRFWGRTGCQFDSSNRGSCETGDCGNGLYCKGSSGATPVTLVEIKLNGFSSKDFYDVSLVDGYNLPVRMYPLSSGCTNVGCHSDVNAVCPQELQVRNSGGHVVACKSACEAFQTDAFCCRGNHSTPQTCSPTLYSRLFKNDCPQAYSYAYDDQTSTFTCTSGGGYVIQFCPPGSFTKSRQHHGRARGHRRIRS